jgi:hypothetical protein
MENSLEFHGIQWKFSMEFSMEISMEFHGIPWKISLIDGTILARVVLL